MPGDVIPEGLLPKAAVADMLNNGFIEKVGSKDKLYLHDEGVENPPGAKKDLGLSEDGKPKAVKVKPRWDMDPKALKRKSLDELNIMIADKDAKVEPFETRSEAIGFLTQDFVAA